MCQISVVVEEEGVEQERFEDVTSLTVERDHIKVSTLFAGPTEIQDVVIRSIDFMAGRVLLGKCA